MARVQQNQAPDTNRTAPPPSTRLAGLKKSFAKYGLTLRSVNCKFDPARGAYRYTIRAARRGSGSRGGAPRNQRIWTLDNLQPAERRELAALPRELEQSLPEFDRAMNVEVA